MNKIFQVVKEPAIIILLGIIASFVSLLYQSIGRHQAFEGDVEYWGWPIPFYYDFSTSESLPGKLSLMYDSPILKNFIADVLIFAFVFYLIFKAFQKVRHHKGLV